MNRRYGLPIVAVAILSGAAMLIWLLLKSTTPTPPVVIAPPVPPSQRANAEQAVPEPAPSSVVISEPRPVSTEAVSASTLGLAPRPAPQRKDAVSLLKERILAGYGAVPMEELFKRYTNTFGPDSTMMMLALVLRNKEFRPLLLEKLRNGDATEKIRLLRLLGDARFPEAKAVLIELVGDMAESQSVRRSAAYVLSHYGGKDVIDALRAALNTAPPLAVQQRLLCSLAFLGDDGPAALAKEYQSSDDSLTKLYASLIAAKETPEAPLREALSASRDPDINVRMEAGYALSRLESPDALTRLQQLSESDPSTAVPIAGKGGHGLGCA